MRAWPAMGHLILLYYTHSRQSDTYTLSRCKQAGNETSRYMHATEDGPDHSKTIHAYALKRPTWQH